MLTIENFHKKLIGKGPKGAHTKNWWVSGIEETPTQYHIFITDSDGKPLNRINIERNAIGEYDAALYELWFWSGSDKDPRHQTPVRRLLNKRDLSLGANPLLQLIDYMLHLK
jgi:hypothetical protein